MRRRCRVREAKPCLRRSSLMNSSSRESAAAASYRRYRAAPAGQYRAPAGNGMNRTSRLGDDLTSRTESRLKVTSRARKSYRTKMSRRGRTIPRDRAIRPGLSYRAKGTRKTKMRTGRRLDRYGTKRSRYARTSQCGITRLRRYRQRRRASRENGDPARRQLCLHRTQDRWTARHADGRRSRTFCSSSLFGIAECAYVKPRVRPERARTEDRSRIDCQAVRIDYGLADTAARTGNRANYKMALNRAIYAGDSPVAIRSHGGSHNGRGTPGPRQRTHERPAKRGTVRADVGRRRRAIRPYQGNELAIGA